MSGIQIVERAFRCEVRRALLPGRGEGKPLLAVQADGARVPAGLLDGLALALGEGRDGVLVGPDEGTDRNQRCGEADQADHKLSKLEHFTSLVGADKR